MKKGHFNPRLHTPTPQRAEHENGVQLFIIKPNEAKWIAQFLLLFMNMEPLPTFSVFSIGSALSIKKIPEKSGFPSHERANKRKLQTNFLGAYKL
jgi:hypothetical protein